MVMYPMSLFESGESNGQISFRARFENPEMDIDRIMSNLTIEELVFAACRGGWPFSLTKKTKKAQLFVSHNYVDNICDSDASTVDGVKRISERVRAILRSYARNLSTLATEKTILELFVVDVFNFSHAIARLRVI